MWALNKGVFRNRSLILILFGILTLTGNLNAAAIHKESCERHETFFKRRHSYTYEYTITTSSEFGGVSASKSGSLISCRVTFEVPRHCEVLMQLSGCTLKERNHGDDSTYTPVPNSQGFLDDLERYELYFQVNKGVIVADSIVADDHETIYSLNIKRGLLSVVQFHILESKDYQTSVQEVDIFGTCSTNYTFSTRERKTVHTYKNLRQCDIRQIYKKQFTFPLSLIRTMHGGFKEGPISEGVYPFVSEVNCDYRLGDDRHLDHVTCVQNQYFQPLAYHHGDHVASAFASVSQDLVLVISGTEKLSKPDLSLDGRSVIDIRFDFGTSDAEHADQSELAVTLQQLMDAFSNGAFTYTDVPVVFEKLVTQFRHSSVEAIHSIMPAKDAEKENSFYLDALMSCGTEACLRCFVKCMKKGHVDPMQERLFVGSLVHIDDVPDDILGSIYDHLKTQGDFNTMLMLPLGTVLSHKIYPEDAVIPADSTTGHVIRDALDMYNNNCETGSPVITERQQNIAVKTISNMGAMAIKRYTETHYGHDPFIPKAAKCLLSKNIPVSVKKSYVKLIESWGPETQYAPIPQEIQSTFLTIVNDPTLDLTLRALTFKVLMETDNQSLIMKLIETLKNQDDLFQLKHYRVSCIRTLLENDAPEVRRIREAWESAIESAPEALNCPPTNTRQKISTVLNLSQFFKHMLTDLWGGNLYVDLVYDPSFDLFSMLRLSLNYHHEDHKYNVAELSIDMHGFDLLMDVVTKKSSLTVSDLYSMYQQTTGQGQAEGQGQAKNFVKFQQNIVKAVNAILDKVNHPGMLNFDFGVELKLKGKNVVFLSIQDVMAQVLSLQAALPPGGSLIQTYLQKAMAGMDVINRFKNIEWAALEKVLPTCAGLPMNMTVNVGGFNYFHVDLNSNALMFMAQKSPSIEALSEQLIVFSIEMTGRLEIPVGGSVHSSGIQMTINAGSERGGKFKVKYGYDDVMVTTENPTKKKIQFSLQPILIGDNKDSEKLLHASGRMFLLHHSGTQILSNDPTVESTYSLCVDPQKMMLLGRSFCAVMSYANVTKSPLHAYFPLSGPFDMAVTMTVVDNVVWYDDVLEYFMDQQTDGALVDNLRYSHTGQGDRMSRHFYFHLTNNRRTGDLIVDSELPELQLSYHGDWTTLKTAGFYDFHYTDLISMEQKPYLGWGYRVYHQHEGDTDMRLKYFFVSPTMSWNWQLNITTVTESEDHKTADVQFMSSYHCSQDHPLLYALHLIPEYAMAQGDTSQMHFSMHKVSKGMQDTAHTTFKYYDKVITVDSVREVAGPGQFSGHHDITYDVDGKQRTMSITCLMTIVPTDTSMLMTTSMDMKSEGFTMHVDQSFHTVFQQSVTVDADINYVNLEANRGRQKRSLSSIYDKFKSLEGVIVSEVKHLEEAILGHKNPTEVSVELLPQKPVDRLAPKFPQIPAIPSIWELPSWNSKLSFAARMQPRFVDGTIPGQSPPEAIEILVDVSHKHPWNAGCRDATVHVVLGWNLATDVGQFRYYINSDATLTDTELDGSPRYTRDGSLDTFRYHGNFNLQKKEGAFDFDLDIKHTDGELNYVFNMLIDKQLCYAKAHAVNHLVPVFTYTYEETLMIDEFFVLTDSFSFRHKMLNVAMDTQVNLGIWDFHNNGSVTYQIFDNSGSFSFVNELRPIPGAPPQVPSQLVSQISPVSQPITMVFTFSLTGPHSLSLGYSVQTPDGQVVKLWTVDYTLSGSSLVYANVHWEPAFDKAVQTFHSLPEQYASFVDSVADHVKEQIDTPLMDKTLPVIPISLRQAVQSVLGPYVFSGLVQWTMITQNLIPDSHRPAPGPSPNIAPRLAMFYKLMGQKSGEVPKAGIIVQAGETIHAAVLKLFSKGYRMLASQLLKGPHLKTVLDNRNYLVAFSMPIVNIRGFKTKVVTDHAMMSVISLLPIHKPSVNDIADAIVMEKDPLEKTLTIRSFDGRFYNLDASQSYECSYLLAADVGQRLYSLVLSPAGLTLVTPGKSVTIGWHTEVYLDDCKGTLLTKKFEDSKLEVKLEEVVRVSSVFGLEIECERSEKLLCYITHKGGRNSTIGLLGNHDYDIYTDRRLLDGHTSLNDHDILAEYSVGGPGICRSHEGSSGDLPTNDQSCTATAFSKCVDSLVVDDDYDCKMETLALLCHNEASKCGTDNDLDDGFCRLQTASIGMCRRMNRLKTNGTLPDVCQSSPPSAMMSSQIGSLDVVFVVSQHVSMAEDGEPATPAEFLSSLLSDEYTSWNQFDQVRLGVVAFGGNRKDDEYEPRVVSLDAGSDNRYFVEQDDVDLEDLATLEADGKEDADGFSALEFAAQFPFSPVAHKMVILLMTKEQGKGNTLDLDKLRTLLNEQGIMLNVISTYAKVASKRVIGINWKGQTITLRKEQQEDKELPKNDYSTLIKDTKGALWDLKALKSGHDRKIGRIIEEFVAQAEATNTDSCPAH